MQCAQRYWLAGLVALSMAAPVLGQTTTAPKKGQTSTVSEVVKPIPDPQKFRQLEQQGSALSISGAEQTLKEAQAAARDGKFEEAVRKNQDVVTTLNQMSTFHSLLSKAFAGIDNRIADEEKQLALQAAIKRDEATYQLALTHRAQGKPELAVPLLVRITTSQNPTRDLGQKAYQQLYEIGFVKSQYPRP
jgi:hypothetical protein